MRIIGMKQLRQKFHPIRKGLERGEEFLLMYRSKPLAVLRPYQAQSDAQHLGNKEPKVPPKLEKPTNTINLTTPPKPQTKKPAKPNQTFSNNLEKPLAAKSSKVLNRLRLRRAFV